MCAGLRRIRQPLRLQKYAERPALRHKRPSGIDLHTQIIVNLTLRASRVFTLFSTFLSHVVAPAIGVNHR